MGGIPPHPSAEAPPHRPNTWRAEPEQKNILFLFRRKNRSCAKSEKRRIFFCEVAAGALAEAGGGAGQSVFRSKKVRAKDIISPQKSESPLAGVFGFSWWDSNRSRTPYQEGRPLSYMIAAVGNRTCLPAGRRFSGKFQAVLPARLWREFSKAKTGFLNFY